MSFANLPTGYELLDFGKGRKLERFGSVVTDRPCPAAIGVRCQTDVSQWHAQRDLSFDDRWVPHSERGQQAIADGGWFCQPFESCDLTVQLRATPAGHVGLFPEHQQNFDRLIGTYNAKRHLRDEPLEALNLFAYTGFGSLQLSAAGFSVAHVDSSKPAVHWAKFNYQCNAAYCQQPVRFLEDDAIAFCRREIRRGHKYSVVCLDPPTYGHGPRGNAWRLDRELPMLVELLVELLADRPLGMMLSGHTPAEQLEKVTLHPAFERLDQRFDKRQSFEVDLVDLHHRKLNTGYSILWANRFSD